jgi:penicillin-binding protein 1C
MAKIKRKHIIWTIVILFAIVFYFSLPKKLFNDPYSTILLSNKNELLQASIAADGQWRFPERTNIPDKFSKALITFEDKRFYHHFGVDFLALGRAVVLNYKSKQIVSGGSTLSMQVIRLVRKKPRTFFNKLIEMILAIRLELRYSKTEILALYANHAPFGGNVVGIDVAAWRYFGREVSTLTWAESACLAILPNSPSLVRFDKNRPLLLKKRNALLLKLFKNNIIDEQTYQLSILEPLPGAPIPLPEYAPHLLSSIKQKKVVSENYTGTRILSTINAELQKKVNSILIQHHKVNTANGINNAAAMVLDIESGNVLSYVGNVYTPEIPENESYVDMIPSLRSPGSTLKPFLYMASLQDGLILPKSLIHDIPTQIAGYSPQNYDLGYDGAVSADLALARSLNVPAVRMLQTYRVERFLTFLKKIGIKSLKKSADHYGLSLILGGGECSLWELAGAYSSLSRILTNYQKYNAAYDINDIREPNVIAQMNSAKQPNAMELPFDFFINAGSIFSGFEAMEEVMRPGEEQLWTQFSSSKRIAWKTGTSFGSKDAWSVGLTAKYVVIVWIGNADGEGRAGLTGISSAAPIMFEIFNQLPNHKWFDIPYDDMAYVDVCKQSGFIASTICEANDSVMVPQKSIRAKSCTYHQIIHLDKNLRYRVTSDCESISNMQNVSWFVLPPAVEWYYKNHHHTYKTLPEYRADCASGIDQQKMMELIYPKKSNLLFIPVELDGKQGACIFEVAHRQKEKLIYWHLDNKYIGSTKEYHQKSLKPLPGKHYLVLVDEDGNRLEQNFEVINRN